MLNEELTVRRCYAEVKRVCSNLGADIDYEHIFADNCSSDGTMQILRELAAEDPRVKVLSYSRNFGAEQSSMVALRHCTGSMSIGIPADLQESPDMIPVFLEKWREGYQVVYGIYRNPNEGMIRRRLRRSFYWLISRLSPDPLPLDFSGFCIMDRVVMNEVAKVDDFNPYMRGIIATIGFRQIGVPYERKTRKAGRSKHTLSYLFGFATNGLITHSLVPIRLATILGFLMSAFSILMAVAYTIMKIVNWNFQAPGATTTVALVLMMSGLQLSFLGMIGEYVGAIHSQVRRKSSVIVRERINCPPYQEIP